MTNYAQVIAKGIGIRSEQAAAAIELLDSGNTLPFIARYRKEVTGGLDEEQIRQVSETVDRLRALDERRQAVLLSIDEQGKLTEELRQRLEHALTLTELDDLYAPYRPKRKTKASIAREKGLQPLADLIISQPIRSIIPEKEALSFLSENVITVEDALLGGRDIVAEMISDHSEVRSQVREKALHWGLLRSEKIEDAADTRRVYESYYDFNFRVDRLKPYQILALNRGEEEKILRVSLDVAERDWKDVVTRYFRPNTRSPWCNQLEMAIQDSASRLLLPAIERDVRRISSEHAEAHAIHVFSSNLRALLSQPPLAGHVVIGIDPGFRTGCKVAVVDATGKLLETVTIYPHEPQKKWDQALIELDRLAVKYHATLISIGNGTASRETEKLAAELTRAHGNIHYIITNEAGASVYSASPLARAELPGLDVSLRGAVSIARRVQDPLAELVKIDPKSIGVGLYQHDVNQAELAKALHGVVESVVNQVGVDLNTASPALLSYVAGIGPKLAEKIVAHRDENGPFQTRQDLKKIKGLGDKAFEQSAGFLRIRDGKNPLDASAIHPESYKVAEKLLSLAGIKVQEGTGQKAEKIKLVKEKTAVAELAELLGIGIPTLTDMIEQIIRPGRDPRQDIQAPILRSDVLSMDDLRTGMHLSGTVRNVVDFGAFVDIGVKQDGLLHRSQTPSGTNLQVGQIIEVEILSIEPERGRIGLKWV